MENNTSLIPLERIGSAIRLVRGQKVLLDSDLAEIYGVETKVLNQAVKRNANRFPEDFMFQLSAGEVFKLNRSQIVTGSQKHRDPRFPPYAFTEHGALMLANVLNSERAAQTSVQVVRAFVRLRQMLASNAETGPQLSRETVLHGSVVNTEMLVLMLEKHGIAATQTFMNPVRRDAAPSGAKSL